MKKYLTLALFSPSANSLAAWQNGTLMGHLWPDHHWDASSLQLLLASSEKTLTLFLRRTIRA